MEKQKIKNRYNFSEIDYDILKKITGIRLVKDRSIFNEWFNFSYKITENDNDFFEKLIKAHEYNIRYYSESQLLSFFISPLLNKVYFFSENFRSWYEYKISGIVNNYELKGQVDFMVASGDLKPEKPYFFFSGI